MKLELEIYNVKIKIDTGEYLSSISGELKQNYINEHDHKKILEYIDKIFTKQIEFSKSENAADGEGV